jgi:hypothetical protein
MAKDTITVGGEQRVVREDTARSYRGVMWALFSVLGILAIAAILFLSGLIGGATDGDLKSPAQIENQRR